MENNCLLARLKKKNYIKSNPDILKNEQTMQNMRDLQDQQFRNMGNKTPLNFRDSQNQSAQRNSNPHTDKNRSDQLASEREQFVNELRVTNTLNECQSRFTDRTQYFDQMVSVIARDTDDNPNYLHTAKERQDNEKHNSKVGNDKSSIIADTFRFFGIK